MSRGRRFLGGWLLAAMVVVTTQAVGKPFAECRDDLHRQARAEGISPAVLGKALATVQPDPRVIRLDRHQPERVLSLEAYLQRLIPLSRVQRGREALGRYAPLLDSVQREYGIEPELLVALWGIETDYGRVLGGFDVTASLVTLACDERRPAFFRRELMHHLHLLDQAWLPLSSVQGSWAGAFGQLQFLPSVLRRYGVDRDEDGRIEVFRPGEDLFATAANYLRGLGWREAQPWGVELYPPYPQCVSGSDCPVSLQGLLERRNLPDPVMAALQRGDTPVRIIRGGGPRSRHFLVLGNFEALLGWNRSDKYALAVVLLMDRLKGSAQSR